MLPVLLLIQADPFLNRLNVLAQAKEVTKLTSLVVAVPSQPNPMKIIGSVGAYEVGRFGWKVESLKSPTGAKRYVVFTTPLTSQDTGELVFERKNDKLTYVPETDPWGSRVVTHSFDVTFMIAEKRAEIRDTVQIETKGTSPEVLMRFSPCYKVKSIKTPTGGSLPFTQAGGVVLVKRQPGSNATYTVEYGGVVNLPQYAATVTDNEATLTNDYWYPMIGRNPAPYEVTVHAPKGWLAVGQGDQVDMQESVEGRTTKFKMNLPVIYYSLSCAPYKFNTQVIEGRKLSIWSLRLKPEKMRLQPQLYAPILRFYEKFAPYPFEGYGALDSELYGGGALEAYSFATYGGGLPAEDAHEPAHTWWGGIINNTYLKSFWNESFAVFCEGLYDREVGIGEVPDRRLAFVRTPSVGPQDNQLPVAKAGASAGGVASAMGYGKGAYVMQMLEQLIGTDRIVHAMREWIRVHPKGKAGEWEDFIAVVKKGNPDKPIDEFVQDWLYSIGHAKLHLDEAKYEDGHLKGTISFTGKGYHMPLDVLVQLPGGTQKLETVWLAPKNGKASFALKVETQPDLVSLDPYLRAYREFDKNESSFSISSTLSKLKVVRDPKHPEYWPEFTGDSADADTSDLAGKLFVGNPATMPAMKAAMDKVGWTMRANNLVWEDTSVDIRNGGGIAVIDLGEGKVCGIAIGKTLHPPKYGKARQAVVDQLGRLLKARTEPKTSGALTKKF